MTSAAASISRSRVVALSGSARRDPALISHYSSVARRQSREYSLLMEMQELEAVEIVEKSSLEALGTLSPDVVYAHVDYLGRELPGPIDLYQRWERQQWSATEIDFSVDRRQWQAMSTSMREQIEGAFLAFFYGEQAVTDTLSPLVHAAPDEDNRLFLSTQLVDEARHSYFFARFFGEALGV